MINSETPYKLAEIIRDTWFNLYNPPKDYQPPSKNMSMQGLHISPNHDRIPSGRYL